jgi:formate dehydrogenase major subunit
MKFSLDGRELDALDGETIWSAANRHGVTLPHLCHKPGYTPAGNCRACMVEIDGERVLAASCCRTVRDGMRVQAASERAVRAQRAVLELLNAAAPDTTRLRHDSELAAWGQRLGVQGSRYAPRHAPPPEDRSHPAMAVNLAACIQCTRCVRACRDEQANDVIGMALRGAHATVVFDQGDPMGQSTCVACG